MAEGLRNAGPSFVRMTSVVLKDQIGDNLLAYVDDIIVKSKKREDHIKDLKQTFENLRKANLKLNPEKCTFGVQKGKILGCIVSAKGIDPNPEKIKAIMETQVPKNVKDIQKLTGRLASLNRFISKAAEKAFPIFQALKCSKTGFAWGKEQQEAFEEIKKYLANPATLTTPNPSQDLLLYISASEKAVSAVLDQEREREHAKAQEPVYFVSEALSGSKIYYSEIEKIAYAVLMATRKLKHYFLAHKVIIPTSHPLKDVLQSCKSSGRLSKWAAEISQYFIEFKKRTAIKSQVLADFITDWSPSTDPEDQKENQEWTLSCLE